MLAPVIDLKSKNNREAEREREEDAPNVTNSLSGGSGNSVVVGSEFDWNVVNEYDPMWPNEYEKSVKELRDIRDREHDQETEQRKRRRDNTRFEDSQVILTRSIHSELFPEERRVSGDFLIVFRGQKTMPNNRFCSGLSCSSFRSGNIEKH